jgi:hypothetical protein
MCFDLGIDHGRSGVSMQSKRDDEMENGFWKLEGVCFFRLMEKQRTEAAQSASKAAGQKREKQQHASILNKPWPYIYFLLNILEKYRLPLCTIESLAPQSTKFFFLYQKVQTKSADACNSWGRHSINVPDTRRCTVCDDNWGGEKGSTLAE